MLTGLSRFFAVLVAIGWMLAGLVAVMPIMFLPMLFDAPGSVWNPGAWAFVVTMLTFPVVCYVAAGLALVACSRDKLGKAWSLLLVPLLHAGLVWASATWMDHAHPRRYDQASVGLQRSTL